ncbi:sulfate ABC transporter permease subunit CysW [Mycolicibacter hiberniae]|uniref:Sulfate ABC transporter permease subunit CysW n=1 Tax=Mycolicibacter hiberniae TaxID=29314 RepID=A0A7I7WWH9_9MYCO|nr:sulfate ABC transporter permease subunit CysW [Mycolicibacter hiberniae]MCV7084933.1 sulfate ABC transporter permease subunit CysW [Mycolicibacter hiberniae]ORV70997.1 sulfate ABC transporter [Mycolicibacter hiberniae]BBZ21969.1 sulfate ABC transporter permease subunit CysW [Mycolicibacter hiberniae]
MTSRLEPRHLLRATVLTYVGVMLIAPVSVILYRTFQPGLAHFWAWVSTPAAVSALKLSLLLVLIVVPLNALFGVSTAILLVRNRFRGRSILQAILDLPFAVSPIIVGVALIALWGSSGALGFVENSLGFKIIFGLPGMVLASIFVTLPFVVREVQPVLVEVGVEQEQAAATLGSTAWQTLWRVTLPSIRWGLTYGIVLTTARTLGEFGAVIMVSSNLPGQSQTLTLLANDRYHRGAEYGAYAVSTLLMGVAVAFLAAKAALLLYRNRTKALERATH